MITGIVIIILAYLLGSIPPAYVLGRVVKGIDIRERGAGNVGPRGGPAGDVIVFIEETEHNIFTRKDDDIICEVPISFSQAALGDEVEVSTLDGRVNLKIPPGTQSGKVFRLKGRGIPHLQGYGKGDELVRIIVWTPTKLSDEEKKLFKRLKEMSGTKPPKGNKSFFDKMRDTLRM